MSIESDVAKSEMSLNLWLFFFEKNALLPSCLLSLLLGFPNSCHSKAKVSRGLEL